MTEGNKVLSSTDVWSKHMYRILCGTCTEIYMADTDTSPHVDCPSVPQDEEVVEPVVTEPVVTEPVTEEKKDEPIFSFGED